MGGDGTLNGMQALSHSCPSCSRRRRSTTISDSTMPPRPRNGAEPRRSPASTATSACLEPLDRPRRDRELRDAWVCDGRVRRGRRHRARAHDRREPSADRDHRGHGPRVGLHRARIRVRPARHDSAPRASGGGRTPRRARHRALRSAEERRHRLRRGDQGHKRAACSVEDEFDRPSGQQGLQRRGGGAAEPSSSTTSATATSVSAARRKRAAK